MSEVPLYLGGGGVGEADGVLEMIVDGPERVRLERGVGQHLYRGYSKLRTRTALGSHRRPMSRSIGPP